MTRTRQLPRMPTTCSCSQRFSQTDLLIWVSRWTKIEPTKEPEDKALNTIKATLQATQDSMASTTATTLVDLTSNRKATLAEVIEEPTVVMSTQGRTIDRTMERTTHPAEGITIEEDIITITLQAIQREEGEDQVLQTRDTERKVVLA